MIYSRIIVLAFPQLIAFPPARMIQSIAELMRKLSVWQISGILGFVVSRLGLAKR
jgi:hypothetical protein